MATVTRTFELSMEAAAELDRRARAANCNPSEFLDMLFLDDELRREDFTPEQRASIEQGMREADQGMFVPHEQVEALLARYRGPSEAR